MMISFTKTGNIPRFRVENHARFTSDNSLRNSPPRSGLVQPYLIMCNIFIRTLTYLDRLQMIR